MNIDQIEDLSHVGSSMTVDFPDHMFVVVFNNDDDARAMQDWWYEQGKSQFVAWCVNQENRDDD